MGELGPFQGEAGREHLSFPKIISAHTDDAGRTEWAWRQWCRIARPPAAAVHPCPRINGCGSYCSRKNTRSGSAADAARRRQERDPNSRAGAFQSVVQHMHSATAISVMLDDHGYPSSESDA